MPIGFKVFGKAITFGNAAAAAAPAATSSIAGRLTAHLNEIRGLAGAGLTKEATRDLNREVNGAIKLINGQAEMVTGLGQAEVALKKAENEARVIVARGDIDVNIAKAKGDIELAAVNKQLKQIQNADKFSTKAKKYMGYAGLGMLGLGGATLAKNTLLAPNDAVADGPSASLAGMNAANQDFATQMQMAAAEQQMASTPVSLRAAQSDIRLPAGSPMVDASTIAYRGRMAQPSLEQNASV